jgi:uncharacterized protein with PIN domain
MNSHDITLIIAVLVFFLITRSKRNTQIGKCWSHSEGKKLAIHDKELCCQHCNGQIFKKIEGLINTSYLMFMQLGFWNRSAACYTCVKCGFIHWFLCPEEKVYREFGKDEL